MSVGAFVRTLLALLGGSLLVGGAYWTLLNVPESNVLALLLSALLLVVMVVGGGTALALATTFASGAALREGLKRVLPALLLFVVGVALFALLWFVTTAFDGWWSSHHGEVDAVALRYTGITRTAFVHTTAEWASWLVRWVVGLSIVVALAVTATLRGASAAASGLRLSVKLLPLLAATAGVLIVSQALWRVAPWRPASLPPTQTEVYFSAVKLGVLYLAALIVATSVVSVYQRAAART